MNSDPDILGRRIQKLRIERGLSQKDLARACGFQAHQTVSMIEKGRRSLSAWELKGLCSALRCDMEALLSESPDYDTAPAILWSAPTGRRAFVPRAGRLRIPAQRLRGPLAEELQPGARAVPSRHLARPGARRGRLGAAGARLCVVAAAAAQGVRPAARAAEGGGQADLR